MKRRMVLSTIVIVAFFCACYTVNGLFRKAEAVEITQSKVDLTGDGINDVVVLKGTPARSSIYFENLTLDVTDGKTHQTMELSLNTEGYEPKLSFGDLTGNGVKDVLVSAATGGSGGTYNYAIATVKNDYMVLLPVPQDIAVTGQFIDGYKAEIKIGNQEPFTLNLQDRKNIYDENNVYQNGKLLKKVDVMVDGYSDLRMVTSDQNGMYALQGTQRVSGFAHYDGILDVVSTWKWDGTHWNLEKIEKKTL